MQPENKSSAGRIEPETPESRVTSPVAHDLMPRRFKNFIVSERELSTLGFMSAVGTLLTTFLGVFVGAAISLGITIKTVDMPADKTYFAFWAGFLVSFSLSVILLGISVLMCIRAARDVGRIKAESEQEKRQRELLG